MFAWHEGQSERTFPSRFAERVVASFAHRRRGGCFVVTVVLFIGVVRNTSAHEGPPFPILMDQSAAGHIVSVWADPDIGEATFYIIVESPTGGPPTEMPNVSMWAEPVSGRLDRVSYQAEQQARRNQLQFLAKPYFDRRDTWAVGFQVTPRGGKPSELTAQVESTPPGFGPWDLAIYLFPFLLLGGMWILAMVRRRRLQLGQQPTAAHGDENAHTRTESAGETAARRLRLEEC